MLSSVESILTMPKGESGSKLSAYERQRLQRIKENEDFLRSLDLSQVSCPRTILSISTQWKLQFGF